MSVDPEQLAEVARLELLLSGAGQALGGLSAVEYWEMAQRLLDERGADDLAAMVMIEAGWQLWREAHPSAVTLEVVEERWRAAKGG